MPFEISHGGIDCNHSGVRSESRGFSEKWTRNSAKVQNWEGLYRLVRRI